MNKNSKILITGGNGKVGRRLKEILDLSGYKNVTSIGRNEVDLRYLNQIEDFLGKLRPTHVFMLAAKVGGIQDNLKFPADYLIENLEIEVNLFKSLIQFRPEKCIFACSAGAYPIDSPNPKTEDMFMSGRPESSNGGYVIAKILGVKLAEMLNKQYGIVTISPMISNIYGTYDSYSLDKAHVISSLIRKIAIAKNLNLPEVQLLGTGEAKREFIHVDDVANGLIFLMGNFNKSEIINLGVGHDIKIKDLASLIASKIGYSGNFKWDGPKTEGMRQRLCDISKIIQLGFTPEITLENGLDKTIKEFYSLNFDLSQGL